MEKKQIRTVIIILLIYFLLCFIAYRIGSIDGKIKRIEEELLNEENKKNVENKIVFLRELLPLDCKSNFYD
ncbi:MAG: hypothetical protein ACOC4G_04515 [Bacillota bacterium]